MIKKIFIYSCLIVSTLSASAQTVLDKVIAQVGGEILLLSDVEGQYAKVVEDNKSNLPPDAKCIILENLITQRLLVHQAKLDSIKVSDEEVESQMDARFDQILAYMNNDASQLESFYGQSVGQLKDELRTDMRSQILTERMRAKLMSDVLITPSEVRAFYSKIPVDSLPYFNSEVEVAEVIYKPKVNEEQKRIAREKVEDILKQIQEGGQDFVALAENYSEDPGSARTGGDLGWAKRGKFVAAFEAQAFKLEKEEISPVFETEYGFHILQLLERRGNSVHTRHILIRPKVTDEDIELARLKMDSVSRLLNTDSMTFSKAVKLYSDKSEQSYNNDGRMVNRATGTTFFETSDLDPGIFFAVDTMQIGKISGAIPFTNVSGEPYFRLVQLQSRTDPHKASLRTDYSKIQSAAMEQKKSLLISTWVADKIGVTFIEIDKNWLEQCPTMSDRWIAKTMTKNKP